MKVYDIEARDGSYALIEGECRVYKPSSVAIYTHHKESQAEYDEAWTFARKRFLRAVAKALGVAIYDPQVGKWYASKEKK